MSKLVEFTKDSYPHCFGDVVKLDDEALKQHRGAYTDYSVKLRAENAQEAEVVDPRKDGDEKPADVKEKK